MLSYEESLRILKETKAIREGHFILSSGLHTSKYVQCAQLLSKPSKASKICDSLAEKIKSEFEKIDLILSPAMGGIIIGYDIGKTLKKETIFSERVNGIFQLMDVYEKEKDRIRQFERHIIENQGQLAQVRAKEAEYRAFMKAKKDSRIQAKIENVARRQRKEEFRRLQTLQKLEAEEQRQKELQETRRKLKLQRKAEEMESMKRKTNLKKRGEVIVSLEKVNIMIGLMN